MSVYWVKETVAADTVGSVDTYADPFGIQYALDNAGVSDEIRCVAGVNNYGSASASWTNRDAVDKVLNVDQVNDDIPISGWIDETTRGLCSFDFSGGTSVGFNLLSAARYWYWKDIEVFNATSHGWSAGTDSQGHIFVDCTSRNNGGVGFQGSLWTFYNCKIHDNSTYGLTGYSASRGPTQVVNCDIYANGSGGVLTYNSCRFIGNIISGNTGWGIFHSISTDAHYLINNTIHGNTSTGLGSTTHTINLYLIGNIFSNNGGYGVDTNGTLTYAKGNRYYNNTSGTRVFDAGTKIDDDGSPLDTSDPQYTDAGTRDFTVGDSTATYDIVHGGVTATYKKGAIPAIGGASGGLIVHPGMMGRCNG